MPRAMLSQLRGCSIGSMRKQKGQDGQDSLFLFEREQRGVTPGSHPVEDMASSLENADHSLAIAISGN